MIVFHFEQFILMREQTFFFIPFPFKQCAQTDEKSIQQLHLFEIFYFIWVVFFISIIIRSVKHEITNIFLRLFLVVCCSKDLSRIFMQIFFHHIFHIRRIG